MCSRDACPALDSKSLISRANSHIANIRDVVTCVRGHGRAAPILFYIENRMFYIQSVLQSGGHGKKGSATTCFATREYFLCNFQQRLLRDNDEVSACQLAAGLHEYAQRSVTHYYSHSCCTLSRVRVHHNARYQTVRPSKSASCPKHIFCFCLMSMPSSPQQAAHTS